MIDPLSLAAIAGFWIGGAFLATVMPDPFSR